MGFLNFGLLLLTIFSIIVALGLSKIFFRGLFLPLSIFLSVWIIGLGLYFLNFLNYKPISFYTGWLIFLNLLSFTIGSLIIVLGFKTRYKKISSNWSIDSVRTYFKEKAYSRDYFYLIDNTIVPISKNFLFLFNIPLLAVSCFYLKVYKKKWILLPLFLSIGMLFLIGFRAYAFYAAVWGIFTIIYTERVGVLKACLRLLPIALLLVSFFVIYGAITNQPSYSSEVLPQTFTSPYLYLTGSFPAFSIFVEKASSYSYGTFTFYPILKFLKLTIFPKLIIPPAEIPYVEIPYSFNTYTYLREFYLDFGPIGIIVFPFFIGLLSTYLAIKMYLRPSFSLILINSLIAMLLMLSVISNQFVKPKMWFFAVLIIIIGRVISKRNI